MYVPTYLPTYLPTLHVPTWPTFLPIYLPTVGVMSRKFETKNVENDFNVCCSDLRGQMKGKFSRSCVKEFQRERERECVCDLCGFEVCGSEWEREREREWERERKRVRQREREREREWEREREICTCVQYYGWNSGLPHLFHSFFFRTLKLRLLLVHFSTFL